MKIINEYDKIYIYSSTLHQHIYQKTIKGFSKYISIHIIPIVLNETDIIVVNDEIVNNKDFQKSDHEKETYESIQELQYPQEYENNSIIILDVLKEKIIKNDEIQAVFK